MGTINTKGENGIYQSMDSRHLRETTHIVTNVIVYFNQWYKKYSYVRGHDT